MFYVCLPFILYKVEKNKILFMSTPIRKDGEFFCFFFFLFFILFFLFYFVFPLLIGSVG